MELLILLVVIGIVIAVVVNRSQRREKQRELEALTAVRAAAEEDVVRFGEDVTLLGNETAGRELDEATRQDYRRALDAYDASKSALDRVTKPDDIRGITGILEDGRYAIACVQARLAGKPVPARLPPCFFNPQHGPSSRERRLGAARRRAALGAGLCGRRRAGPGRGRTRRTEGAGRGRPGAVLAGRPRLQPLRAGLLLAVRDVRPAPRAVPRARCCPAASAAATGRTPTATRTARTRRRFRRRLGDGGGDGGDGGGGDGGGTTARGDGGGSTRRRRLGRWRRLRRRRLRRRRLRLSRRVADWRSQRRATRPATWR